MTKEEFEKKLTDLIIEFEDSTPDIYIGLYFQYGSKDNLKFWAGNGFGESDTSKVSCI